MEETSKVYRIRTKVGNDAPNVIHVPLNQAYDMFEILSLKMNQTNTYKTYQSDYGIIVGRVMANGNFGIPNAKVSVFIAVSDDDTLKDKLLYNFTSTNSTDNKNVRYNLLPDYVDDMCHQNVGTFPNKRLVLDNQDVIDMFDKYWKYTTTTNNSGDYMIFGVPTGSQTLHCDVDLSDCGILSQRPRDMIYKGYNAEMFESPNKFKTSSNLNSLVQIISQDKGVYVYPYWGDISDGDDQFAITRCDIEVEYKFEPTAIFMGSIVTDKGSNAIGKNCTGTEANGKMSDLISGEGTIEMIRKTIDNKVEEFPIKGNRLIDSDGVWCYQIPMNLDLVMTDEFGNLVPTDNPEKGIATRARVRFRISLDENPNDATARKRARYLVPNNPRMGEGSFDDELEADYEFGSATREESYCDLFWNKVYTVKNYIPKLQKNSKETNRKHTGIKLVNHYGDNNPMPYNALTIKLSFTYRIICVITKVVINLVEFLNEILSIIGAIVCLLVKIIQLPGELIGTLFSWIPFGIGKKIKKKFKQGWNKLVSPITKIVYQLMPNCIGLSSEFCDDGINQVTYYPGCGYFLFRLFSFKSIGLDCIWDGEYGTKRNHQKNQLKICENEKKSPEDCEMSLTEPSNQTAMLYNCIENQLAQQNDATSFNFNNDWINGVLYAPLWYRKITPKRSYLFGLIKKKAKDDWCSAQREYPGMRILQQCTVTRDGSETIKNFDGEDIEMRYVNKAKVCDSKCHKQYREVKGMNGVIQTQTTMLGQTVYYYKAVEHDASLPSNPLYNKDKKGDVKLMFATDIVLLGSLNECDINGIPQFFKSLESTTYNMPSDILFTDYDFIMTINEQTGETDRYQITDVIKTSEMAGCDWGNPNEFDKYDGGLFYSIGCSSAGIKLDTKSCINLSRICEYGVSLDETKEVANLNELDGALDDEIDISDRYFNKLITDGFISWDELYNLDERSMFATMNGNRLKTRLNENGMKEYDFRYLYPENFDGSLEEAMKERTKKYSSEINYKNNWRLEARSEDYYKFRMGNQPYFYDMDDGYAFPRYENSFYFYFGLKAGKTAIEKFNSRYFAECSNPDATQSQIGVKYQANSWCSQIVYKFYEYHTITQEDVNNGFTWVDEFGVKHTAQTEDINQTIGMYKIVNDGYLALDFSNIQTPYDLVINNATNPDFSITINGITEEKIVFAEEGVETPENYVQLRGVKINDETNVYDFSLDESSVIIPMLDNGSYEASIVDGNGNIVDFTFKITGKYLSYKVEQLPFEQPNNVLMETFLNDLKEIASDDTGIDITVPKNIQREIGGVVNVHDVFMNAENLDFYTIEIKPKEDIGYGGLVLLHMNGTLYYWDNNGDTWEEVPPNSNGYYNYEDLIYYDGNNYAFGVPKGKCTYTVTITQRCETGEEDDFGIDSNNSVSKDIFVDSPTPYKMFINDIDYDLLKRFDNHTGWDLSGNLESPNATLNNNDGRIDITDNPWFMIDNIYYNRFEYEIIDENDPSNNETIDYTDSIDYFTIKRNEPREFYEIADKTNIIDENTYWSLTDEERKEYDEVCKIYAVTTTNEMYEVLDNMNVHDEGFFNILEDEFTTNKDDTDVPYNWVDDYIVEDYDDIDTFINKINNVLNLRKDLVLNMKDAFYLTCVGQGKSIVVRGQTNKLPCTQAIVYHPEKAVENDDVNTLDGDALVCDWIDAIDDIKIPTITYKGSINFGDGSDDVTPWVAKEGIYEKKPYSVGIMNYSGVSIPRDNNDASFEAEEVDNAKYIKKSTTNHDDLFSFPIIDKILSVDYIAWSAFVDIPKFNVQDKASVTMNGLVAGAVFNGNMVNDTLYNQTLNNMKLILSSNLGDTTQTYVEKRVINGFDYDDVGNNLLTLLKNSVNLTITRDLVEKMNQLFNYEIIDPNNITQETINIFKREISNLKVKNGRISYTHGGSEVFGVDVQTILDYALSFTNYITDDTYSDKSRMQYAFVLPMDTFIIMQDKNGCGIQDSIAGNMTVTLSEESVNDCLNNIKVLKFDTEGNDTYFSIFKYETDNYPINHAVSNGLLWQINDEINGIYDSTSPQNMLSFQMKSEYLRGTNNLIDTNFKSQVGIDSDDESEEAEYEETFGYGTTGEFEPLYGMYPIFVVAESGNVRALSPVYDYSNVQAIAKRGVIDGENVFGVAITNGNYYIENYPYTLSCTCKINGVTTTIQKQVLLRTNDFIFTPINSQLAQIEEIVVTATDYTKLKHICYVTYNSIAPSTIWCTYTWKCELPISPLPSGYVNTFVYNYEKSSSPQDITVPNVDIYEYLGFKLKGWTLENQSQIINVDDYKVVSASHTFCAVWNQSVLQYQEIEISPEGGTYELKFTSTINGEFYDNLSFNNLSDDWIHPTGRIQSIPGENAVSYEVVIDSIENEDVTERTGRIVVKQAEGITITANITQRKDDDSDDDIIPDDNSQDDDTNVPMSFLIINNSEDEIWRYDEIHVELTSGEDLVLSPDTKEIDPSITGGFEFVTTVSESYVGKTTTGNVSYTFNGEFVTPSYVTIDVVELENDGSYAIIFDPPVNGG